MSKAITVPPGTVFGRLTAIEPARTPSGRRAMLCQCECGQMKVVDAAQLRSGHTQSCGCLQREAASKIARTNPGIVAHRTSDLRREQTRQQSTKHGVARHAHYILWRNMTDRCLDPGSHAYHWYGARGITVCPEWRDAAAFCAWMDENMGPRPPGKSFDRIRNNGNYEPGNVRWTDAAGQIRNSRTAKITMDIAEEIRRRHAAGEPQPALASEFGVCRSNISQIVTGKTWRAH
jgi:hypothetical protein